MAAADADVVLVYVTASGAEEARAIARALVAERLAACVNIPAPHTAIYRWQGEVAEAAEQALLAKTTRERLPALAARVRALSSYGLPAIMALPAVGGDADFLGWVAAEVGAAESGTERAEGA
jgi:periplasmic divalent cation tolerance protein